MTRYVNLSGYLKLVEKIILIFLNNNIYIKSSIYNFFAFHSLFIVLYCHPALLTKVNKRTALLNAQIGKYDAWEWMRQVIGRNCCYVLFRHRSVLYLFDKYNI